MTNIIDDIHKMALDDLPMGVYDKELEDAKILRTRLKAAYQEGFVIGYKEALEKRMIYALYKKGICIDIIASSLDKTREEVLEIIYSQSETENETE